MVFNKIQKIKSRKYEEKLKASHLVVIFVKRVFIYFFIIFYPTCVISMNYSTMKALIFVQLKLKMILSVHYICKQNCLI